MVAPTAPLNRAAITVRQYEAPMHYFTSSRNKAGNAVFTARSGKTTYHPRKPLRPLLAGLFALPLLGGMAMAADSNPLADKVRAADARFADVAVAKAEGYAPIPCVSGPDGGAMGIHYVNQKLLDDPAVDVGHPEAVLYEPQADGSLKLVAVEYITEKGPGALGGQLFSFTNEPNRYGLPAYYALHVWAWRDNPMGVFADMNPTVSCSATPMGDGM
jgi:hypothetical protein